MNDVKIRWSSMFGYHDMNECSYCNALDQCRYNLFLLQRSNPTLKQENFCLLGKTGILSYAKLIIKTKKEVLNK